MGVVVHAFGHHVELDVCTRAARTHAPTMTTDGTRSRSFVLCVDVCRFRHRRLRAHMVSRRAARVVHPQPPRITPTHSSPLRTSAHCHPRSTCQCSSDFLTIARVRIVFVGETFDCTQCSSSNAHRCLSIQTSYIVNACIVSGIRHGVLWWQVQF